MTSAPLLAVLGPTASGKTEAAIELAKALNAEIVSVDSMLVYRGMDVGTAKPSTEQRARVPHHMIDVAEPSERFSVARYQQLGREALRGIAARGRRAILTGGSGLYVRALVDDLELPGTDPQMRRQLEREAAAVGPAALYRRLVELDPPAAAKVGPANVRRTVRALEVAAITGRPFSDFAGAWDRYPPERLRAAGVEMSRDVLAVRIEARVHAMLRAGWLAEVQTLMDAGLGGWLTSTQAIGYAELARHLQGRMTLEDAVEQIAKRTRHLARRQVAWFRRDPRVRWFPVDVGGAPVALERMRAYLEAG